MRALCWIGWHWWVKRARLIHRTDRVKVGRITHIDQERRIVTITDEPRGERRVSRWIELHVVACSRCHKVDQARSMFDLGTSLVLSRGGFPS